MAATVVVALGGAAAAATGVDLTPSPGNTADGTAADPPAETAEVTRQTLVETRTESGRLGFGETTTATARIDGTLTGLPDVGDVVDRGEAMYSVDDAPVVLLHGSLPAYRTLEPGVEGDDVAQFEENLAALGYEWFTVDDTFDWATAAAVTAWQRDLGWRRTGTVDPGRIVYAEGAVRVGAHQAAVGDLLTTGTALFGYTATDRVVEVDLDTSDRDVAETGTAVEVTLPDGTTIAGKVVDAESVVDTAEDDSEQDRTVLRVTVAVDEEALTGLDEAVLSVGFAVSRREDVLTVPVAALLASAEGGYAVEVVTDGRTRLLPVELGLFADGRVEVTGEGLAPGMTVGMPS
ncbi:multidrug efflux pump subunit AcrA (membrane-fusion protein) [Stackebrandtia albiflava]|uniref:Multidrug efflux pump subunit AcrA (Membrane-fusion protein) n=1 Tax=Stackebrandtia albiflava TaxID=406432 RepID=A0A562VCF5_9ACTN|nr:multidrug efflux pump subunit AcrA (membrane-fusion protein) [Stackebrandtia albiflava]